MKIAFLGTGLMGGPMAKNLADVYKNISRCKKCGSLKSNQNGCNNF